MKKSTKELLKAVANSGAAGGLTVMSVSGLVNLWKRWPYKNNVSRVADMIAGVACLAFADVKLFQSATEHVDKALELQVCEELKGKIFSEE